MSDGSITEVLETLDMASYLDAQGIEYRETHGSRGAQLNVKTCPACGTSKWKVFLNAETGLGNCFSGDCEAKYNKFSFIRAHLDLDNKKTAAHIFQAAKDMGWRPPRKSVVAVKTAVDHIKLPHSFPLPIEGQNLAYLHNRGISLEVAQYMHLRYCQKGLFGYTNSYGERKYQDFSNRIIIPVFDMNGELVSFQGRDITGTAEKKYLFPNGFASTGTVLYNSHNVHNTERVAVGEGVFDVAALKMALDGAPELRDVVPIGTFGKHLSYGNSDSQLSKFLELQKRGVKEVTMIWDGETKATDAAIDAGNMLRGIGFRVRVALLPKDKDPNEICAEGVRAAFYKAIALDATSAIKIKMARRGLV
jgi:DNA primase